MWMSTHWPGAGGSSSSPMLTLRATPSDLDEGQLVAEAGHHLDDPSRDPQAHLRPPPSAAGRGSTSSRTVRTASSTAAATGGVRPIPSPVSATWQPTTRVRAGRLPPRAASEASTVAGSMPCASTCRPVRDVVGSDVDHRDGTDGAAVGQRVDQHQHVPRLEQVVGQVQAADPVVGHPDAARPRLGGQPPDDLAPEAVVGAEHVPDAGDQDSRPDRLRHPSSSSPTSSPRVVPGEWAGPTDASPGSGPPDSAAGLLVGR